MSDQETYHKQTAKFLSSIATCMPKLSNNVMEGWIDNPKALQKVLKEALCPPEEERILEFLGTVDIPATKKKKFVVKKKFITDTSHKAEVKISYLGCDFKEWFLSKTEEPIERVKKLHYGRLTRLFFDNFDKMSIANIAILSGEEKAQATSFTEIFSLLERQPNGECGVLLNNGGVNIFNVHDIDEVLREVCMIWYWDGWSICTNAIEGPFRWLIDRHRVFFSNSC